MVQLKADAAYVRKSAAGRPPHLSNASPDGFDARVYELLETPHTVTSLGRALGNASADDPAISQAMRRLLDQDLIELSPDS